MDVNKLLKIIDERGFLLTVVDGKPAIKAKPGCCPGFSQALFDAVKTHAVDLLNALGYPVSEPPAPATEENQQNIELLWPGTGYISRHWLPQYGYPAGAYFFRTVTEQFGVGKWQPIPGRAWNEETRRGTAASEPQKPSEPRKPIDTSKFAGSL